MANPIPMRAAEPFYLRLGALVIHYRNPTNKPPEIFTEFNDNDRVPYCFWGEITEYPEDNQLLKIIKSFYPKNYYAVINKDDLYCEQEYRQMRLDGGLPPGLKLMVQQAPYVSKRYMREVMGMDGSVWNEPLEFYR
jgi:hypothetical protein